MTTRDMRQQQLHIHPLPARQENGEWILAADLIRPDGSRTLWFAVDANQRISSLADPFLVASLFMGMKHGWDIHVHGVVSSSLLENLQEFQAIWQSFHPERYQLINLSADRLDTAGTRPAGRISTYSGGVDSSFTALSHAPESGSLSPLDAGLMIHGLDIPLADAAFAPALQRAAASLASLGLDCLSMRTNFREVVDCAWEDVHATALAACLHILAPGFGTAMIPSTFAYSVRDYRVGSNPLTDPLLGSDAMRIVHDGARFTRDAKLARLAAWPQGLDALRVCWQGALRDRNCCRCEKCLRNMVNIHLLGMPMPASFPEPLSAKRIATLKFKAREIGIWQRLIDLGEQRGLDPDLLKTMRRLVGRMRLRQWLRSLKRWEQSARQLLRPWRRQA